MNTFTRRSILLTSLAALAIQKHAYRFDHQFLPLPAIDVDIVNGSITLRAGARKDFRVAVETPDYRRQRYSYRHNVEVETPASTRLILRGVNGAIHVTFDFAPTKDLFIKNVNGEIEVELPAPLNADFQMRTINGRIYSAYDMTSLPGPDETEVTERGMRRIVTRNRFAGGRVGSDGCEIRIEGLNGDIRVSQRKA